MNKATEDIDKRVLVCYKWLGDYNQYTHNTYHDLYTFRVSE